MITRPGFTRNWGVAPGAVTVPAVNGYRTGPILTGATQALRLAAPAVARDPSDRTTWRRGVRFT